MTTITIDRAVVEQALEALDGLSEDAVCQSSHHAKKDRHTSLDVCPVFLRLRAATTALRAALAQQAEPVVRGAAYADALRWTIKACGAVQRDDGVWFGDDAAARLARVLSEGIATPQQAEPVEPAFHGFMSADGTQVDVCFTPSAPRSDGAYATAYYTAPPQRKPLSEEEIERLWYASTVIAEPGKRRVAFGRAIERAHGIGEGA